MALRDVNLVPDDLLQQRIVLRHGLGWAISAAVIVVLLLGIYTVTMRTISAQRRSPISEQEVRKRIALTITEIEAKKEEIERLAFVRNVAGTFRMADILDRLTERLDPKVWLANLSIRSAPENSYEVMMQGRAFSNTRLGASIRALTDDPLVNNVALRSSNEIQNPIRGEHGMPPRIVKFSIQARIAGE